MSQSDALPAEYEEYRVLNRDWWNEVTPLHETSALYDLEGFVAGAEILDPVELAELGNVAGKRLVHLQCHFGMDTLAWERHGAEVTGLDFSASAIESATALAKRLGSAATFVEADVYRARDVLHGAFDVVYTGRGALNWLPDLGRWAEVVASLLAPGGVLYLIEIHPLVLCLDDDKVALSTNYSYFFEPEGVRLEEGGDYAEPTAELHATATHEWTHHLGEVIRAVLDAGLVLELVSEHDHLCYQPWPFLEPDPVHKGIFRLPPGQPKIPLLYSLKARRPN